MFTGEHPFSIDDKGRVAVPARFRHQLSEMQGTVLHVVSVSTSEDPPHLEIYPATEFQRLAQWIQEMPDRKMANKLKRGFIGPAAAIELDSQGRITLPQKMREQAGLGNRAMVVGQYTRFDVWDETAYEGTAVSGEELADALNLIPR